MNMVIMVIKKVPWFYHMIPLVYHVKVHLYVIVHINTSVFHVNQMQMYL